MGRGRAKAKQAKVARQLKYSGASTDLDALRKELLSGTSADGSVDVDDSLDDEYEAAEYGADDDDFGDGLGDDSYGASGAR
jgi:hypothetical protein